MDVLGIDQADRVFLFDEVKEITATITEMVLAERERQSEKEKHGHPKN